MNQNLEKTILQNEFQLRVLQKTLNYILGHNPEIKKPSSSDSENYHDEALTELRLSHPDTKVDEVLK